MSTNTDALYAHLREILTAAIPDLTVWDVAVQLAGKGIVAGTAGEPSDIETMAEAVHDAYLETCARLGWSVKPANAVPYAELPEDAKELDRASVRAVLRAAAAGAAPASPAVDWKQRYEEEAAAHRLAHAQWLEARAERDALRASPAVRALVDTPQAAVDAAELVLANFGYDVSGDCAVHVAHAVLAALAAEGERP